MFYISLVYNGYYVWEASCCIVVEKMWNLKIMGSLAM